MTEKIRSPIVTMALLPAGFISGLDSPFLFWRIFPVGKNEGLVSSENPTDTRGSRFGFGGSLNSIVQSSQSKRTGGSAQS